MDLPPHWKKRDFQSKVTETDLNIAPTWQLPEASSRNTAYFGLVFVDGCHAYDFVHQDTANALRYLRPGGLIVWHDYGMLKDVSRVVDENRPADESERAARVPG